MPVEFMEVIHPPFGEVTITEALRDLHFTVKLKVEPWTHPKQVIVEAWTNIRTENVGTPSLVTYRGIRLQFIGPAVGCCGLLYSTSILPVWIGDHSITFRARERFRRHWVYTNESFPAKVHIDVPEDPKVANKLARFQFYTLMPKPLQVVTLHMYEQMVFWIKLNVLPGQDPEMIQVQAWSNVPSIDNPSATQRGIPLHYRGSADDGRPLYGERTVMTGGGDYTVTYRVRLRHKRRWFWVSDDGAGVIKVSAPLANREHWLSEFREAADYVHLAGPVYVGCKSAVENLFDSKTSGLFTHVLCVAGDITKPIKLPDLVTFHRIPIENGVQNVIDDDLLLQAIDYIRKIWNEFTESHTDRRLLIYSRYGFSRAGSVAVAYIMAENSSMTFEQALNHVTLRRPVAPHSGLEKSIERLWPRVGVELCSLPGPVRNLKNRPIPFQWISVSPDQSDTISVSQFQEVVYYVKILVQHGCDPGQIVVEAWTNLRSPDNPEGIHHGVPLRFRGMSEDSECGSIFGEKTIAVGVGEFDLTYRAKVCANPLEWTWVPSNRKSGTIINVGPPEPDKSMWAETLRTAPESERLIGPIHFGSEVAVVDAPTNARFTHVLCVAEELTKPSDLGPRTIYEQIPFENGVENVISDVNLARAVDWLREVWEKYQSNDGKLRRAIVYCRYGFARAASVAVAYILAEKTNMTYEEAIQHVNVRRPVLPHSGLKDAIYRLYPRPWLASHRPPLPIRHASTTDLHMSADNWICLKVAPDADLFAVQYRNYAEMHATRILDADLFAIQYRIWADVVAKLVPVDADLFAVQLRLYDDMKTGLVWDDDLFTVQYRLHEAMQGGLYTADDDMFTVQYRLLEAMASDIQTAVPDETANTEDVMFNHYEDHFEPLNIKVCMAY